MINEKAWFGWIQDASENLVADNFRISETEITFEFACVVNKENNGSQLGGLQEDLDEVTNRDNQLSTGATATNKTDQEYKFAKLLVLLPTFEGFQLRAESPKSNLKVNIHQSPGDPTLAIWFHGALPTVEVEGPALCLLYSIYIPLAHKDHYLPRDLKLPDETAALHRLRQLLQEWATETTKGGISQLFLPCILDNYYDSFDTISGRDALLRDKLLLLAKELGLHFYYADFEREVSGQAQGWQEYYGRSRYYSPGRSEPDLDSNGKYIIDEGHNSETSWSLSNLYDVIRNKALQAGQDKLDISYPPYSTREITPAYKIVGGEDLLIVGNLDFTTAEPEFSEEYDLHGHHDGELHQTWNRTALLLWHPDVHGKLLVNLCGWDAALLLTSRIDPNGGGAGVQVEPGSDPAVQMAIAEELVLNDTEGNHATYEVSNDEACLCLLKFALESKQKHIFLATLAKLPPSNPGELALLLEQASVVFSEGNSKSDEILVTAVGPYANTVKWISFLRSLKEKGEDVTLYHARVAEAHTCNFHPVQAPAARPATSAHPGMLPASIPTAAHSPTLIALKFALECKNHQVIALLLKQIAHTIPIAPAATTLGSNHAYAEFILLIYDLIASNAPYRFSTPTLLSIIQHFFLLMVLKHLLPPLGIPPFVPTPEDMILPKLALQPVTCRENRCADCPLLSAFLTSHDRLVWYFSASIGRRSHLAAQLSFPYVNAKNIVTKEVSLQPHAEATQLEVQKVGSPWADRRQQWHRRREELGSTVGKLFEFFGVQIDAGTQEWKSLIERALGPQGGGWDLPLSMATQYFLGLPWPELELLERPQKPLIRDQASMPVQPMTFLGQKRKIWSEAPGDCDLVEGNSPGGHAVKKRWNIIDLTESDTEEAAA
ncbi:hypothetical protein BGX38DRAFT_1203685 [Terfezia claveryi]|nr:hypothetical protein BGX38DRAFT_1203685 [Terfezia claveryi]